jgi:hypothetical protein
VPRGLLLTIRSGHPISATWLFLTRRIWPSDLCHVASCGLYDLTIRSLPRGSIKCVESDHPITAMWVCYTRRIWPSDRCHVAPLCTLDLTIRLMPDGSFSTVRSGPDLRLRTTRLGDRTRKMVRICTFYLHVAQIRRVQWSRADGLMTWHRSGQSSGFGRTVFFAGNNQ